MPGRGGPKPRRGTGRMGGEPTRQVSTVKPLPVARSGPPLLTLILVGVLMSPGAASAVDVDGRATASGLQVDSSKELDLSAYLLGFRTEAENPSPYAWDFEAEAVNIDLVRNHYTRIGVVPMYDGTTESSFTHWNATGRLLERWPLSYMMATSPDPKDPARSFTVDADLPIATLRPTAAVSFKTGELQDEQLIHTGLEFSSWDKEFSRSWLNLAVGRFEVQGTVILHGDFVIHLFDMDFGVWDHEGRFHRYETRMGDDRGDGPPTPVKSFNDTIAELRFTNATFTFHPEGRPLQMNLRSVHTNASGEVYLEDVRGSIQDPFGVTQSLDGANVQLDAESMAVELSAAERAEQEDPVFGVRFWGDLGGAIVDGRSLDVGPSTAPPSLHEEVPPPAPLSVAPSPMWDSTWTWVAFVVAVVGGLGLGVWWRRHRFDVDEVMGWARLALDDDQATQAKRLLDRILRHDPLNTTATMMVARLMLRKSRPHEAVRFLEPKVGGVVDQYGAISLAYCTALRNAGRIEEARQAFKDAQDRNPDLIDREGLLQPRNTEQDLAAYI